MQFTDVDSVALVVAREDKERIFPELTDRCRLIVVAFEIASSEAVGFVRQLAFAKAWEVPSFMQFSTALAWERCWTRMLSTVCSLSFAASLVEPSDNVRNVVLDRWGATTFGGFVGEDPCQPPLVLGPNSLFSADRSHSRVTQKRGKKRKRKKAKKGKKFKRWSKKKKESRKKGKKKERMKKRRPRETQGGRSGARNPSQGVSTHKISMFRREGCMVTGFQLCACFGVVRVCVFLGHFGSSHFGKLLLLKLFLVCAEEFVLVLFFLEDVGRMDTSPSGPRPKAEKWPHQSGRNSSAAQMPGKPQFRGRRRHGVSQPQQHTAAQVLQSALAALGPEDGNARVGIEAA